VYEGLGGILYKLGLKVSCEGRKQRDDTAAYHKQDAVHNVE
jgi:hypothetical protein